LAKVLTAYYVPSFLKKKRKTRAAKLLSREQREQEFSDCYEAETLHVNEEHPSFLILDDIVTTGTTIKAVINAIRKVFSKASIYIFTLASTQYNINLQEVQLIGYTYEWKDESGWVVMEENEAYDTELSILKNKILSDSF